MRYTQNLKKGDLIGVAYNNYIWLGIFDSFSERSTRFYLLTRSKDIIGKGSQKIWKDYINRADRILSSPVVKMYEEDLNEEDLRDYKEFKDYLTKIQIL